LCRMLNALAVFQGLLFFVFSPCSRSFCLAFHVPRSRALSFRVRSNQTKSACQQQGAVLLTHQRLVPQPPHLQKVNSCSVLINPSSTSPNIHLSYVNHHIAAQHKYPLPSSPLICTRVAAQETFLPSRLLDKPLKSDVATRPLS
jgi:hypothetical protein